MPTLSEVGLDGYTPRGRIRQDELNEMLAVVRRVNARRLADNITMTEIAREIGVNGGRLSSILTGHRKPTRPVIQSLRNWLSHKPAKRTDPRPPVDLLTSRLLFGDGHIERGVLAAHQRNIEEITHDPDHE